MEDNYYEIIIKTKEEIIQEKIDDLKKLKELLQPYINDKIEVELHERKKIK